MMRTRTGRLIHFAVGLTAGLLAGLVHVGLVAALNGFSAVAALGGTDTLAIGVVIHLLESAFAGIVYMWLFKPPRGSRTENPAWWDGGDLMSGLAYGLLLWIVISLNLSPILMGKGPQWQVEAAADTFPSLLGYLFQGAMLGVGYHLLSSAVMRQLGPMDAPAAPQRPSVRHRIVILGGGFAGVTTAQHLERRFARDFSVEITLISDTNHLLFTPMLSEVAAGSVEARHISAPLRAFFRRTQVIRSEVLAVDLEARVVQLATHLGTPKPDVPFDHLVLALGAVPNFFGLEGVKASAFTFKSLEDAIRLRNHVVQRLESADAETDAERRKAGLTFVVAGGGFAGAELIGGLNDFVRGAVGLLVFVRSTQPRCVTSPLVVCIHSEVTLTHIVGVRRQ